MECVFCKIVIGEIPCKKIYEDDNVLLFLDINPYSLGHTLIIPKKHVLDFETIDEELLMNILKVAKNISKLVCDKLGADGYKLIQNNGLAQEVKHFHLHIIPVYNNEKKMSIDEVYKKITE